MKKSITCRKRNDYISFTIVRKRTSHPGERGCKTQCDNDGETSNTVSVSNNVATGRSAYQLFRQDQYGISSGPRVAGRFTSDGHGLHAAAWRTLQRTDPEKAATYKIESRAMHNVAASERNAPILNSHGEVALPRPTSEPCSYGTPDAASRPTSVPGSLAAPSVLDSIADANGDAQKSWSALVSMGGGIERGNCA